LPAALAENSTIDPNRAAVLTEWPSVQNLQTSEKQCKSITTHHAMKESCEKPPSNDIFAILTVDPPRPQRHKHNNAKGGLECLAFF
jgi:heme-degrading monooxygenase HmoA